MCTNELSPIDKPRIVVPPAVVAVDATDPRLHLRVPAGVRSSFRLVAGLHREPDPGGCYGLLSAALDTEQVSHVDGRHVVGREEVPVEDHHVHAGAVSDCTRFCAAAASWDWEPETISPFPAFEASVRGGQYIRPLPLLLAFEVRRLTTGDVS